MKIGDLIGTLFLARDVTHKTHLATRSYAKHMALGDFYQDLVLLADSLAEAWQGRNGLIPKIPVVSVKASSDIVKFLQGQLADLEAGRAEAIGPDSALQNIMDEIVALYLSTLYKLQFLA